MKPIRCRRCRRQTRRSGEMERIPYFADTHPFEYRCRNREACDLARKALTGSSFRK